MNHVNKKLTKLALPISTNTTILHIKKKIKVLKIEHARCTNEENKIVLADMIDRLGNHIQRIRIRELNRVKEYTESELIDYKKRLHDKMLDEVNGYTFSRKYMRKFKIDKGITIYYDDIFTLNYGNMLYRVVEVSEPLKTNSEYKSHFVTLEEFDDLHVRAVTVPLYQFISEFSLRSRN